MAAFQEAGLGEDVEEGLAHLLVQAIGRRRRGAPAMARGGGARVSASSAFRGGESERVRGETGGAGGGTRPGSYPLAGRLRGRELVEGERENAMARGRRNREGDDPGVLQVTPCFFYFLFIRVPFLFVFLFPKLNMQ